MKPITIIVLSLTAGAVLVSLLINAQVATTRTPVQTEAASHLSHQDLQKAPLYTLEKEIENKVEQMSLEDKAAQLFMVGFEGTSLSPSERSMIQQGHVGGVILLGRNVRSDDQLHQLVTSIKQSNSTSTPLFVGIDEEGGRVSRIPASLSSLPSSKQIGNAGDPELSYDVGQSLAAKVKHYGINMNFAPVLDINNNPDNEVIGDRSFGSDPETVTRLGIPTMKGIRSEGVIPVVKHFPGHGDTSVDSHAQLPIINKTTEQLNAFEWVPFKKAIQSGADAVMTAHILFPALDEQYPATFSKKVVTGVLREQMNYDGLVITDDMAMGAISENYGTEEAVLKAIEAGVDIVLLTDTRNNQFERVHQSLLEAVEKGELSEEQIDESVKRILKVKQKYKLSSIQEDVNEEELNQSISDIQKRVN
ncbi:beta-N-acetylhexosaminidase [Halobacillus litoralis]|uniref:beta-N-acetylhexosaminidase n=1 Tax=Halobacillus litoralis TaxID=45668 RepID=UPI001CD26C6B|nr:beta-N-acetylhexosaminidase [Halobacillus litoralis]MCA0971221.1 beta-N-acetylhexosaminidase [Halobacillus litoralis]